jgi:iron complex outermembrane receptor protein
MISSSDRGFIKSFNQELRISNGGNTKFRWVVGGNYEKSHVYEYQLQTLSQISTAAIFGYTGAYVYSDQRCATMRFSPTANMILEAN